MLDAMDQFTEIHCWMFHLLGREKRKVMDRVVQDTKPKTVLELGTYCGYSAISIARVLEPGSRVYTVAYSTRFAEIAKKIIAHSGLSDRIEIVTAAAEDVVSALESNLGIVGGVDLLFMRQLQSLYTRDLKALVDHDGLHPGSVVVADNVIFTGAPEYVNFIRNDFEFKSTLYEVRDPPRRTDGMEVSTFQPKKV